MHPILIISLICYSRAIPEMPRDIAITSLKINFVYCKVLVILCVLIEFLAWSWICGVPFHSSGIFLEYYHVHIGTGKRILGSAVFSTHQGYRFFVLSQYCKIWWAALKVTWYVYEAHLGCGSHFIVYLSVLPVISRFNMSGRPCS